MPPKPGRKGVEPAAGLSFAGFATGPLHRGLAAAIAEAARTAGQSKVEVSVVRAPALYLLALWLRDETGDRLVPMPQVPRR